MGAALDWMTSLSRDPKNWKTARISYGPAFNQLVCLHPDSGRLVLRSGECECVCVCVCVCVMLANSITMVIILASMQQARKDHIAQSYGYMQIVTKIIWLQLTFNPSHYHNYNMVQWLDSHCILLPNE